MRYFNKYFQHNIFNLLLLLKQSLQFSVSNFLFNLLTLYVLDTPDDICMTRVFDKFAETYFKFINLQIFYFKSFCIFDYYEWKNLFHFQYASLLHFYSFSLWYHLTAPSIIFLFKKLIFYHLCNLWIPCYSFSLAENVLKCISCMYLMLFWIGIYICDFRVIEFYSNTILRELYSKVYFSYACNRFLMLVLRYTLD